jgi:hypothetical protein
MEVSLGGVRIRMAIESPVEARSINVVKRIHPQLAPLNIESSGVGVTKSVRKGDLEFRRCDDVIVCRRFDQRLKLEPKVTNPLERR